MKIYVCYKAWDYEGCSEPLAAFDSQDKAKAWVIENQPDTGADVEYVELDLK